MANFVGVLRDAIDRLNDNRPATRGRIYEIARLNLAATLTSSVSPPSEALTEHWKSTLEEAIAEVESSFSEPPRREGIRSHAPDGHRGEYLNLSLRIAAIALQKIMAWSQTQAETFRWAKIQWGKLRPNATGFSRVSGFNFKFWHLLAVMGGASVIAPLVVLPRAPVFLGPICAINAVVGIVVVVKAKRLEF